MVKANIPSVIEEQNQQTDNNRKLADCAAILRRKYTLNNKVLFIQPPQFMLDTFNLKVVKERGCYAYPPAGLQCIAKALSKRNLDIDIIDLNYLLLRRIIEDGSFNHLDWLNILDDYLKENHPYIIGATCISIYADVFKDTHPLTCLLKHLRKIDKAVIIAGGSIATNEYEGYLKKDLCHFVVAGEGENKINFLFDHLFADKQGHISTPGIYFKFENSIEETNGNKDIVALKGNLVEAYKNIPVEDYKNVGSLNPFSRMAGRDKPFTGIQLNRGCRANCKFCGVIEFMGQGLRQYPVQDLLEEIHYLVKERGVRYLEILDDDLLGYHGSKESVLILFKEMVKLNKEYEISWGVGNGFVAASLNEELLNLMRDSGCVGFRIGIESGNEKMLRRMRKPTSLPLLKKVGVLLQKFPELFVGGNYIIGLFGEETFGEMLDTLRFSNEINLDWSTFAVFQFTNKSVSAYTENLMLRRKLTTDFIPVKDSSNREILGSAEIITGPAVFKMAKETIPSQEQIKHIWFAFNLVANYINNKNLKPGGRPEKFISWIEAVRIAYPDNPYMPLFAGIGYVLLGNKELANDSLKKAKENLIVSQYWKNRFDQFDLNDLVTDFPQGAKEVQVILQRKRNRYLDWIS